MSELPASQCYSYSFATSGKETNTAREHGNAECKPFLRSGGRLGAPSVLLPPRLREALPAGRAGRTEQATGGSQAQSSRNPALGRAQKGAGTAHSQPRYPVGCENSMFQTSLVAPAFVGSSRADGDSALGRRELWCSLPRPHCKGRPQSPAREAGVPLDPICSSMLLGKHAGKR